MSSRQSMEIQGTVRDILRKKGDEVWTASLEQTVYEAVRLMGDKNIGALVVLDANGSVAGVVSERDYSRKVVLCGRTSRDTRVAEILGRPPIMVRRDDGIDTCMQLMTRHRIRHLPVVDRHGGLAGLVSIGDLVSWVMESQEHTILQLQGFIHGGYPV